MKLARKFDLYAVVIIIIFVVVFLISLRTMNRLSSSTVEILDISREVNFLTEYRNSLINLEHAIDHYLHAMRATGYTADIESNLSEFRRLIEISESIKLDEEKEDILEFARKNLVGFSLFVEDIIRNKTLSSEQEIEMINTWKRDYLSRMLADINKQWLKDSKKVEELTAVQPWQRKTDCGPFWLQQHLCYVS